jgi:hypothetical protein
LGRALCERFRIFEHEARVGSGSVGASEVVWDEA